MGSPTILALIFSLVASWIKDFPVDTAFRTPIFETFAPVGLAVPTSDGKLLIAGPFSTVGSFPRHHLARVLSDGRPDLSFDAGQVGNVNALIALPNGAVLFGGTIIQPNGDARKGVFRLNVQGEIDGAFNATLPNNSEGYSVVSGAAGKFYVQTDTAPYWVRLNADGSLDPQFTPDLPHLDLPTKIVQEPSGTLLIHTAGYLPGRSADFFEQFVRLSPSGKVDPSFSLRTSVSLDRSFDFSVRPDGRIWLSGLFIRWTPNYGSPEARVMLVDRFGRADPRINFAFNVVPGEVAPTTGGGAIVAMGAMHVPYGQVVNASFLRFTPSGLWDRSYAPKATGYPISIDQHLNLFLCQPPESDISVTRVVQILPDGRPNSHFRVAANTAQSPLHATALSSDELLVSGGYRLVNGVPTSTPILLDAFGIRQMQFSLPKELTNSVEFAELKPGQLLVAPHLGEIQKLDLRTHETTVVHSVTNVWDEKLVRGSDGHIWAVTRLGGAARVYRLNADGNEEAAFGVDAVAQSKFSSNLWDFPFRATSVLPLRNGGLIAAAHVEFMQRCIADEGWCAIDIFYPGLFRYDRTGALDESFQSFQIQSGALLGPLIEQTDGKIIVTKNTDTTVQISRIFPDGREDTTFTPTTFDASPEILKTVLLPDDSFVIAGTFTRVNGTPRRWLARIPRDGGLDETFRIGNFFDGSIGDIIPMPDGSWIIHGVFEHVAGIYQPGLARVRLTF